MLKNGIIHPELAKMLASMGHGDMLLVTDAGFPIPRTAWRIDLAIVPDFPDLVSILRILHDVFIAERVSFAQDVIERNQPPYRELTRIFDDCDLVPIAHETILNEIAHAAKGVVRTAGYTPWGNIALVSGTDPFQFFKDPEIQVTDFYRRRMEQLRGKGG